MTLNPTLLPFRIVDYDTHSGIDVIVKGDHSTPISNSKLFYVEFKYFLTPDFNHSFENLHSIVCWDTEIKHDDTLSDISKEERRMVITRPSKDHDYTKYMLINPSKVHNIEVFVLKDLLKEKLKLEFRPRPNNSLL